MFHKIEQIHDVLNGVHYPKTALVV